MELRELQKNAKVSLCVARRSQSVQFEERVIELSDRDRGMVNRFLRERQDHCIVKAIRKNGKLVNLAAPGMCYYVISSTGGMPYIWKNISIVRSYLPDAGKVEILIASREAVHCERRRAARISVGAGGTMARSQSSKMVDIRVLDISMNGVGIIVKRPTTCKVGDLLRVQFKEKPDLRLAESNAMLFNLEVKVARISPMDSERVLIGARIVSSRGNVLPKYIAAKKRALARLA